MGGHRYKLQRMIRNYYESLGVARTASTPLIAESYRKLALRYHPKTTKEPQ
jgi:curved DNA-binding protein CbpA